MTKGFRKLVLGVAMIGLAACASSPSYRPAATDASSGYAETKIENDRFRVTYRGKPNMSVKTVQDYALMRAAELTLQEGGEWFEVVSRNTEADKKTRTSIDTDFGPDYTVTRSCGLLGCTARATPVLAKTETATRETTTLFEHTMEIRIGEGDTLAGGASHYNARETLKNLRAKLG
ncbi:MAG: hypothetical protein R3C52_12475 [Hyphomonadaceae bacterium]